LRPLLAGAMQMANACVSFEDKKSLHPLLLLLLLLLV
jgi:hypothetical protein